MSDDDLQSRIEQAETNWQSATQGNPRDNTWGFFSYSDAPAGIGGGVGMFIWFPNRNEMLDFIATTLPYAPAGQSNLDWGMVSSKTAAIVEEMKPGTIEDLIGVERLNEVLKTFSQIQWMGTFEELLRGGHSYAAEVREAFRDEDDEGSSGAPIQPDEQAAFCEYLETWGI
jgi:hypothetical protein